MLNKIRSNYILKLIFENLKKRIELKIIRYNKRMSNKLHMTIKDFENFKLLKEFNQEYNLNIKDIETEIINLENKKFGNGIFKYFTKIEFSGLKELNLSGNKLLDIKNLEGVILKELKNINLSYNLI